MAISDQSISDFRKLLEEVGEEAVSFDDARVRLRELLVLYWTLAHRPPQKANEVLVPPPPSFL
jgi:hypothetical protein